jgi:hypothetical protein
MRLKISADVEYYNGNARDEKRRGAQAGSRGRVVRVAAAASFPFRHA